MKRVGAVALTILCGVAPALAGPTLEAIEERGTLRVGTTGDYKPFAFRDANGDYRGADVDMASFIAARLGVRLAFVPTTWATLNGDFAAGKFDIAVGGVTVLADRAKLGDFSRPLLEDGKRPIVRCADKERFTGLAVIDAPGVRVITNPGASNEQFAREHFPHAQLTVHTDNVSVFDELVAGRADVMVTDGIEVEHQALLHPELCPAHVPAPFTHLQKAYLVQHDPELLAAVNATVTEAQETGAWARLLDVAQHAN